MRTRSLNQPRFRYSAVAAAALAALAGCGVATEGSGDEYFDPENVSSAIEHPNGGLDMNDEEPMFGMDDLFTAGDQIDVEQDVVDELANDPAVIELSQRPDAAIYRVLILWGQLPPDRTVEAAREWTGRLSIDRGAMIVRRTVAFESATDQVLPRTDRRTVSFQSVTRPAVDGLIVTIIDPEPGSAEPLVLHYRSAGASGAGEAFSVAVRALVDGAISEPVDDLGNQMIAVAMARPVDVCEHGFLAGRWHQLREGRGRLMGRVVDAEGELRGHVLGLYGQRRNGEKVFFGKYINLDGQFRGILAGHYGDGRFVGRWLTRAGETGRLGGEYRETLPGPEIGGQFLGRWAETSCNMRLDAE